MRVVCHSQHLTGVGHHVRMHCIAASLAAEHEVHLVDGGRPVPRPPFAAEPGRLVVPTLVRSPSGALVGDHGEPGDEVLARRAVVLADAVTAIRPDVVLVDHYPFSKWELSPEIDAAVSAARAASDRVQVVCSLRDIAPQTRHEGVDPARYASEVARRLDAGFDALLVHGDPAWSRLADHFPTADALPVPVRATGYVVEPPPLVPDPDLPAAPFVVASAGGLHATEFLAAVITAHARLVERVPAAPAALHVFAPAGADESTLGTLRAAAREHDPSATRVVVHPFAARFGAWRDAAALSVSRAGYNTCAASLRSPAAIVLVPDPRLSDQVPRARLLDRGGAAVALASAGAAPGVDALTGAMADALARRGARSTVGAAAVRTDGAAVTVELLTRLVAREDPWAPEWREPPGALEEAR